MSAYSEDIQSGNPMFDAVTIKDDTMDRTESIHGSQQQRSVTMNRTKKVVAGFAGVALVAAAVGVALGVNGNAQDPGTSAARVFPKLGGATHLSLDEYLEKATAYGITRIEDAINPKDSITGSLVAALSGTCPNYSFTWARDQALVYQVILNEYKIMPPGPKRDEYEQHLKDFATHTHSIYNLNSDPLQSYFDDGNPNDSRYWSIAEAKHENDGTMFKGGWCNPQNDGVALRATVLMEFADKYMEYHPEDTEYIEKYLYKKNVEKDINSVNPIKRDLEYLYHHWDDLNCEPWEEIKGRHFYNRIVARRAFIRGAAFARKMNDPGAGGAYESRVAQTEAVINSHWKPDMRVIIAEATNKENHKEDVQTVLATIHSNSEEDEYFNANDPRTMANALYTIKAFDNLFGINKLNWNSRPELGVAIGRYIEDTYNGKIDVDCNYPSDVCPGTCGGQPWFLATNGLAEFIYKAVVEILEAKTFTVDSVNNDFLIYFGAGAVLDGVTIPATFTSETDEFKKLVTILIQAADSFVKRTQYHTDENFRLDEQYNADTGIQMSAGDLTWSYASLTTAYRARKKINPTTLIPSYTTADAVEAHVSVVRVPLEYDNLVVVGNTDSTGNGDPCNGVKMYKRRNIFGSSQWSTFVKLPKSSAVKLRVAAIPNSGCQNPIYPASGDEISITTSTTNAPEVYYSTWCSADGCLPTKNVVKVELQVRDVPSSIQSLALTGDAVELGSWNPCKGPRGTKSGDTWIFNLNLVTAKQFEYKAVGIANDNGADKDCGFLQWEEGTLNNNMGPFVVDPQNPEVNIWSCPNCKPPGPVTVTFVYTNIPSNAALVRVVGSVPALGNFVPCEGVVATKQGNEWKADVVLESGSTYYFKAIVFSDANDCNQGYDWEAGSDNQVQVTHDNMLISEPWGEA